jgi:hypothetical protein
MLLTEVYTPKKAKRAVFCFGRMNPPTLGHARLMNTVARAAQSSDYFIFVSPTEGDKKNPLSYFEKIDFIQRMFPQHADHVVVDSKLRTPDQVLDWLYNKGYTDVTMVLGSDRFKSFEWLKIYNGKERKSGGYYKFNSINFVSSGTRDEDSDDLVSSISASRARALAADNTNPDASFAEFNKITGARGGLALKLYKAVRRGMGMLGEHIVKHGSGYRILSKKTGKNMGTFPSKAAAKKHEREIQYFKHVGEEAAGVGVVATNKKMAKDPRYSSSMTVDVHPDTLQKNAKALKLA